MNKPRLFIGSSTEGINVAFALQDNLKYYSEITVWNQGVFNLSETTLESLIAQLNSCDFGIFVFTPDDHIKMKNKKDLTVRDNVLFELGLFIGKLGKTRCYIVMPDNTEFHFPSDLIGMTPGKYEAPRTDNNLQAATGSVSHKIQEAIIKFGCLNKSNEDTENATDITPKIDTEKEWTELLLDKDYDAAIKKLNRKLKTAKDIEEKVTLKGYLCHAFYEKDPVKGKLQYEKLINDFPTNNTAYLSYAYQLQWNHLYLKAVEVIDQGLIKCQRKITLTNLKVDCLWKANQKDNATTFLLDSMKHLSDPSLNLKLVSLHLKKEQKTEALEYLYKSYQEYPNDEDLLSQFAKLSFELGHKDLSVLLYKELLYIDKCNSEYWCLLGNSYLDLKLYSLALSAYEKANEIAKEKESWILSNIGNLYNNKELFEKAEFYLTLAQNLDSKSDYTHSRLSQIYQSKKDEQKKLDEFLESAKEKLNGSLMTIK
jgi:tetratricopeptide (TPR) repeat protein